MIHSCNIYTSIFARLASCLPAWLALTHLVPKILTCRLKADDDDDNDDDDEGNDD